MKVKYYIIYMDAIIHDIRNILNGLNSAAEMTEDVEYSKVIKKSVAEILNELDKLAEYKKLKTTPH
jgi:hypothetical protein